MQGLLRLCIRTLYRMFSLRMICCLLELVSPNMVGNISQQISKCATGLKHFLKIRIGSLQQFDLCFVAKLKFSEVKTKGLYVIL